MIQQLLIKEGISGYVVAVGDVEAVAAKIKYVVNNPSRMRDMSIQIKAPVSLEDDAVETANIYENMV